MSRQSHLTHWFHFKINSGLFAWDEAPAQKAHSYAAAAAFGSVWNLLFPSRDRTCASLAL